MRSYVVVLVAGTLFATGLVLAGTLQPEVILRAFSLSSRWDPRLPLLFAGATLVQAPVTRWLRRRGRTLPGKPLAFAQRSIDGRLVIGSILFGIGWGLAGVCPGPGVSAALSGAPHVLAFLGAFVLGIGLYAAWHERPRESASK